MRPPSRGRFAALLAVSVLFASIARAGQVRVDVGSGGNFFTPATIQLNQGDHVVWMWIAGGHTTTSGTVTGGIGTPNGIWDSGTMTLTTTVKPAFTWKSDRTGNVPYYCAPHANFGMVGTLQISASGVAVSNFRITEVHYTAAAGLDRIQVTNMGSATGDLGRYRITSAATTGATTTATLPGPSVPVLAGASVTLHWGAAGTNTATDLFLAGLADLGNTGSLALYAPNTKSGTAFTDATQIIDYVEWGAAAQPNEATANTAGVWTSGQAASGETLAGYSISYCGSGVEHGAAHWQISTPNFGTASLCATPTIRTTWGRLKSLYR